MGRAVITGAEVATAGRVLTQVARSAAGSGGGPASASKRAAAYTDFQASVAALLTWAELTETVQRSVSPSWRDSLAAVSGVVPPVVTKAGTPVGEFARAFRPVALLMLAARTVERLEHARFLRSELGVLRDVVSRHLAALAEVRLVGGAGPLAAAEDVTALLGELLVELPTVRDQVVRLAVTRTARYEELRDAVGFHLRRFTVTARQDLATLPWRRRVRTSRWTIWRPKPEKASSASPDVAALLKTGG